MNESSSFPGLLNDEEREAICLVFDKLEVLPVSCLFYRCDRFCTVPAGRKLPDDWIYIPKKGRLRCTVGTETRDIGPGELILVAAGKPHHVTMAPGIEYYEVFALHLHVLDSSGRRFLDRLTSSFGVLPDSDLWFQKLAACTHLMHTPAPGTEGFFRELTICLLYEQLLHGCKLSSLPVKMDPRISGLFSEVRAKCGADWSVPVMAGSCHLSVSRFRELFSKCTGVSPKKFVQRVRLTHARSLLSTDPMLSVAQVAEAVGMRDPRHFHKAYKDTFGETPRRRSS